ncbi:MAG: replication initiation protein [Nitrosospira sp.]
MAVKKSLSLVPSDTKEFKKANDIIAPRVLRGGTLSLLGRKVINVLLYHTQRFRASGVGAPEGDPVFQSLYWLPLADLSRDAAYDSEDTALLKATLVKLQDIKIITDNAKGFSSDVLIASVKIVPGQRGNRTMVGWGLHPASEAILKNPEFYTRLSIYYLTSLHTTGGVALYETCKRYVTNPSHLSNRERWEWWHDVLTGLPVTHEKPEYKYFKRDTLKTAIAEVNTTDIRVELIEHKAGRRVVELQFRIEKAAHGSLELPPPIIDTKLINRLEMLGISKKEAEDIFASNDEAFLKATLDLVETRSTDQSLSALVSPAAFFRSAVRGRYVEAQKQKLIVKPPPVYVAQKSTGPVVVPAVIEGLKRSLETYDAMITSEKADLLAQFVAENPIFAASVSKNPESKSIRAALFGWMAKRTGRAVG